METDDLKPWMRGPYELIQHANEHANNGKDDLDRRIALIGFDNAIEVCVDVFIRLHPKLRAGLQIGKTEAENALRNYHAKIEFLDRHVQAHQIPLSIPVTEIVWYHQLRNELYHSGNGMVPEKHVVSGARSAALAVFRALFGIDISSHLAGGGVLAEPAAHRALAQSQNAEMEFLRWYVELEQTIRGALPSNQQSRSMPLHEMLQKLAVTHPELHKLASTARDLANARNAIAHGAQSSVPAADLNRFMESIIDILDHVQALDRRSGHPS